MSPTTCYILELVNGFTGPSAEQLCPEGFDAEAEPLQKAA